MPYRYNPFSGQLDLTDISTVPTDFASQFDADSGSATPSSHIINLLGDATQGTQTSASGNTVTFTALDASTSQKGTIEIATDAESIAGSASNLAIVPSSLAAKLGAQTQYGVAYGGGLTNAVEWTDVGTDGQLLIAATGAPPAFASLTSTGGTVTFTPSANGLNLEAADSVAITFDGDSGSATPAANTITFAGGTGLTSSAAGSTVTYDLDSPVTVANGGTGATTLTDGGIVLGSGTGPVTVTSQPTNGQLLIGSTGVDPVLATLTSTGSTIAITNGAGSVNLETGDTVPVSFSTDSGSAVPSSGVLTIAGGTLLGTTGSGSTVTVNADDNVVGSVATDSGTVTPSSNSFTVTGSGGITTSGSGSTLTIIGTSEQVVPVTLLDDMDSTYTVLTSDYYLSCDVSGGVLELDFPNAPSTGSVWIVKDSTGSAATNNITVTTVGGVVTIDGGTSFVMNTNYEAIQIIFNGTSYEVF